MRSNNVDTMPQCRDQCHFLVGVPQHIREVQNIVYLYRIFSYNFIHMHAFRGEIQMSEREFG